MSIAKPGRERRRDFATRHLWLVVLATTAAVSLVFLLFPSLDIAVSRAFHRSGAFPAADAAVAALIRNGGRAVEAALAIAAAAPLLVKLLWPESRLVVRPRSSLFLLASFALGPGLLVNVLLKEHWGRARPREIVEFGGNAEFSPVWVFSDACPTNCSFVSGEAASAFWLVSLVFVAPPAWRATLLAWTLCFAAIVSATRIAMGGHFISDVLLAWLLTLLVLIVMDRIILKALPLPFDRRVEAALARGGLKLRALLAFAGRFRINRK